MCQQLLRLSRFPGREEHAEALVMRTFAFLRQARYSVEDICSICAHASEYFRAVYDERGAYMSPEEAGYTLIVCLFLAHSFCSDYNCSSRSWHRNLLADYCSLAIFEEAIMLLLKLRGYRLRITDDVLVLRYKTFLDCAKAALLA